jgi:hypothetical protein
VSDWESGVRVCAAALCLGDEALSRHLPHRGQNALVPDSAATELAFDHPRAH